MILNKEGYIVFLFTYKQLFCDNNVNYYYMYNSIRGG